MDEPVKPAEPAKPESTVPSKPDLIRPEVPAGTQTRINLRRRSRRIE